MRLFERAREAQCKLGMLDVQVSYMISSLLSDLLAVTM